MQMIDDFVFVSVAFGDAYVIQQQRLKESILKLLPNALLHFYTNEMPRFAREHYYSNYGFKPHAVWEAMLSSGRKRLIWLDPAMILVSSDLTRMTQFPVVAVKDDHKLSPFISDQALKYLNLTRDGIANNHLVGGSLYYFDTRFKIASDLLADWRMAEVHNMYGGHGMEHTGSAREHRQDEALMAGLMAKHSIEPQWGPEVGYCIEHEPLWIKKHFK